jgi:hypothetical protein
MQENTTFLKRIEVRRRSLGVACMLLASAALMGCDEQPSPSASPAKAVGSDSAAKYAALSSALERCDADQQKCLGQPGASEASCDSAAEACREQTKPSEADAQGTLEKETRHCRKICTDDDAGPDDADGGSGDMDGCIGQHAPRLPKCLSAMIECLDEAGAFDRSATRSDVRSCVSEAHSCIKEELAALRELKRQWWREHLGLADAGAATAGGGGEGTAGSGGDPDPGSAGGGGDPGSAAGSGGAEAVDAGASDDGRSGRGRKHKHGWRPFWERW